MQSSATIGRESARGVGRTTRGAPGAGTVRGAAVILVAALIEAVLIAGLVGATLGIGFAGPSTPLAPVPAPPPVTTSP